MHRIIGFFNENSLWILLGFATLVSFWWLTHFKEKLKLKWYASLITALIHTVLGVLAVKVFAFLESSGKAGFGSMSLFGAVFGMPVLYLIGSLVFKRKPSDVFDVFTFATVIALFCARINCIVSGCCLGIELSNGSRVPTREIELVFYFILLNILLAKVPKDKLYGRAYPLFMMSYGLFRFIIEFFRETNRVYFGVFHIAHLWATVSFIIGIVLFIVITKRHNKKKA